MEINNYMGKKDIDVFFFITSIVQQQLNETKKTV